MMMPVSVAMPKQAMKPTHTATLKSIGGALQPCMILGNRYMKNAPPDSYPTVFRPESPAKYALETNSGWADANNIKYGDKLIMLWKYEENLKAKEDMIKVASPKIGAEISSPLIIEGEARGNWFFEASFPVKITDSNGNELAVKPATANSDWMTTEFVPFSASLEFTPKETDIGFLILKKDNPSGFSENDDQIEIPIRFR